MIPNTPTPAVDDNFRTYQRVGLIEARPWTSEDEYEFVKGNTGRISISPADRESGAVGTLHGGYVARNPNNHDDQWYIAPEYFAKHYATTIPAPQIPFDALVKRVMELEALTNWTHTDDVSVNRFCVAMIEKLAKKRDEGRSGWDDPQECTLGMLAEMLVSHLAKGDPVDIANFCMMVWTRGETDEDHAPAVQAIRDAALSNLSHRAEEEAARDAVRRIELARNEGFREGWMRCGAYHVDVCFESPEEHAEVDRRLAVLSTERAEGK